MIQRIVEAVSENLPRLHCNDSKKDNTELVTVKKAEPEPSYTYLPLLHCSVCFFQRLHGYLQAQNTGQDLKMQLWLQGTHCSLPKRARLSLLAKEETSVSAI